MLIFELVDALKPTRIPRFPFRDLCFSYECEKACEVALDSHETNKPIVSEAAALYEMSSFKMQLSAHLSATNRYLKCDKKISAQCVCHRQRGCVFSQETSGLTTSGKCRLSAHVQTQTHETWQVKAKTEPLY